MTDAWDRITWFILGALVTLGIQLVARQYGARRDELAIRTKELCDDINTYAVLASEYWMTKAEKIERIQELEIRLVALQHRIGVVLEYLSEDYWFFKPSVDNELVQLRDLVTGGAFGVKDRPIELARCAQIYLHATELSLAILRARRITLRKWI